MELQNFIDSNENYIQKFRDHGLKVMNYSKYKCILVKNYYDKPLSYTNEEDYWKMYCRGAIIDTEKNKVICLPPEKVLN